MSASTLLAVALALGLSLLIAVLLVAGTNRMRRVRGSARNTPSAAPPVGKPAPDAGHERHASAAAEMLESIVQRRMAADPAFSGQGLDFGTSPDGSLEIWWNDQTYASVDQLPDDRLRELIAQAIEEFNQGGAPPA